MIDIPEIPGSDTEKYLRAKKRVEDLKGFYSHLGIYILINLLLFIANAITSFGIWWFYWVTLFWGIGIVFHAVSVFKRRNAFSKKWEEEKIQQYMNEEE